ncbi:FecR family protein [Steroidobacter sp.]|uniref:FecR family protein n=1 Tax=Steroidobacter sp. TaxID=1978227 RepID=UPI001A5BFF47|nr:FecR domain-containing protein [Steroidobacter sp.]MBL8269636.1 FecR domain-containing protein [Steroidobacter sp.]
MEQHTYAKFSPQIHEQATEWLVEFRTGTPDEAARRAFHAWLMESPAHVEAYLEASALWSVSAQAGAAEQWTEDALIAQAVAEPDNVFAHPKLSATPPAQETNRRRGRSGRFGMAAAACVLMSIGGALAGWQYFFARAIYSTDVGEQRSFTLSDGSIVNLNARSKIRVHYGDHERLVELVAGQALFTVAKNAQRPFIVRTAAAEVRAVGTQFDVYRKAEGTVVTVVEGRVAVTSATNGAVELAGKSASPEAASGKMLLSAGERVTVQKNTLRKQTQLNTQTAVAWTQRQLVFESTPLAEVAEEFNRYNERPLVVLDTDMQRFEIDGVFSSTDSASLVRFLRTRPGVRVTESNSQIVIETANTGAVH